MGVDSGRAAGDGVCTLSAVFHRIAGGKLVWLLTIG